MLKKIAFVVFGLGVITSSYAQSLILPIVEVHDGDTIVTALPLPEPLSKVSIRIFSIDTPEMPAESYATTGKLGRAQCAKEAELAIRARNEVRSLAAGASFMTVTDFQYDKYGGRILGNINIAGVDVASHLIELGFAIPYYGDAKTHNWCQ